MAPSRPAPPAVAQRGWRPVRHEHRWRPGPATQHPQSQRAASRHRPCPSRAAVVAAGPQPTRGPLRRSSQRPCQRSPLPQQHQSPHDEVARGISVSHHPPRQRCCRRGRPRRRRPQGRREARSPGPQTALRQPLQRSVPGTAQPQTARRGQPLHCSCRPPVAAAAPAGAPAPAAHASRADATPSPPRHWWRRLPKGRRRRPRPAQRASGSRRWRALAQRPRPTRRPAQQTQRSTPPAGGPGHPPAPPAVRVCASPPPPSAPRPPRHPHRELQTAGPGQWVGAAGGRHRRRPTHLA